MGAAVAFSLSLCVYFEVFCICVSTVRFDRTNDSDDDVSQFWNFNRGVICLIPINFWYFGMPLLNTFRKVAAIISKV